MIGVSKEKLSLAAGKITLIYLVLSVVWVIATDRLVAMYVKDPTLNLSLQTYKGWFFVAITGALLFILIRREERANQEVGARSKILLEAIPDIVFRFNIDGVFVDYSAEDEKSLAMPPEQFLGRNIAEVLPQDIALPMMEAIKNALQTGKIQIFEYKIQTPKGLMFSEARVVAKGGEAVAFVRDVTERSRYIEALKNSEEKFGQVFKNNPELMMINSLATGAFWDVNDEFLSLLGYERGEVLGKTVGEVRLWDDGEKTNLLVSELREKRKIRKTEMSFRKKDGGVVYLECSASVINLSGVEGILLVGVNKRNTQEVDQLIK